MGCYFWGEEVARTPFHLKRNTLKNHVRAKLEPQYVLLIIEPQSLSIQRMLFGLVSRKVKIQQVFFRVKKNPFESSNSIAMNY